MTRGVIFDVDGTLFDTGKGIKASVRYALEAVNAAQVSDDKLDLFIGPSLFYSFTATAGLDESTAVAAVEAYREHYWEKGVLDSFPYDGVPQMLDDLSRAGYVLGVASSKPLIMVRKLLDRYGYDKYFEKVVAPDYARRGNDKAEMIKSAASADKNVMVGDTHFDIDGAHDAGLRAIAAMYGFGKAETLEKADARAYSPREVFDIVRSRDELFERYVSVK